MEDKDNELRVYTELDVKKAYFEGVKDKTSLLAVIFIAFLTTSVVGSIVGEAIPLILEVVFKPTIMVQEKSQ